MEDVTRRQLIGAAAAAGLVTVAAVGEGAEGDAASAGRDLLISMHVKGFMGKDADAVKKAIGIIGPILEKQMSGALVKSAADFSASGIKAEPKDIGTPFKGVSVCVGT